MLKGKGYQPAPHFRFWFFVVDRLTDNKVGEVVLQLGVS